MAALPIIQKVEFFRHEFQLRKSKVPPRPFSSLTFRISGKISVSASGAELISTENTVTFIPCNYPYETEILEDGEMFVLHFWTDENSPLFAERPICARVPHSDTFINLFERALRHMGNLQNPYAPMADAYRLLSEALPLFFVTDQSPHPKMIACKRYLDEHIGDCELRVSTLATQYGCSAVYFRSEFRKCYGCSPIEYIQKRRLEIACHLLQTNLYSVAEVATQSGFDSISYFSAQFRRAMGCTPKEYRDQ